jgi:hypothetical protein
MTRARPQRAARNRRANEARSNPVVTNKEPIAMTHRKLFRLLAIPLVAARCGGCVAEVVDDETLDAASAVSAVEAGQSSLAEVGCQTVRADATLPQPSENAEAGGSSSASPNGNYGQAGCTRQWVVEFDTKNGKDFDPHIQWADAAIKDESTCKDSSLQLGIYQRNGDTWSSHRTEEWVGTWSDGNCTFLPTNHSLVSSADSIRLAGAAFTKKWSKIGDFWGPLTTYKKVRVGLRIR